MLLEKLRDVMWNEVGPFRNAAGLGRALDRLIELQMTMDDVAIAPEAAIYLTIKIDLTGKKTKEGKVIENQSDVTAYILNEANLAVVPFYAFGADRSSPWYRLSVGTCKKEEIKEMTGKLREALKKLN